MLKIKFNETTKTFFLEDDNVPIGECKKYPYKKSKSGIIYKLPENSYNRVWIDGNVMKDGLILTPHIDRATPGTSSKKWTEYLTKEEKATIEAIKEKCLERLKEATKPMTEEEKLLAKIERLKKQYEEMLKKGE